MASVRSRGAMKILLAVILLVVLIVGVFFALALFYTPVPEVAWVKTAGTSSDDFAYSVSADPKGNVYVAGASSGAFVENSSAGFRDLIVAKYSGSGNMLWSQQFGTSSWEEAYAVASDKNGDVFVAGYTYGGLGGNINAGKYDIFVTKYDASGKKLWVRQEGSKENDYAYSIALDGKGNIYLAGYTYGAIDAENAGGADAFLMKLDAEGKKLWARQIQTPSDDVAYSVAVDSAGNPYVTGYTGGALDGNKYSGGWDAFLIKYDSDGKKLWSSQLGSASWEEAWAVAVDTLGNAYIAGYTGGSLEGKTRTEADFDAFIAKFDSSGKKQWVKTIGTAENDYANSISIDPKGNICIAGYTGGKFKGTASFGMDDVFIACLNAGGRKLWVQQLGSPKDDYSFGIATDSQGNIYASGETAGAISGAPNKGGYDLFVLRLNAPDTSFMSRLKALLKAVLSTLGIG